MASYNDPFSNLTAGGAAATMNNAIPGFSSLTSSAAENIRNLLTGMPSVSQSRLENAWYGAGTGLGSGSEFLNRRGVDLYGQKAEGRRQQGIQDYLALLSGASGTLVPTTGETLQNQQFGQSLAQDESQFSRNLSSQRSEADSNRAFQAFIQGKSYGVDDYSKFPGSAYFFGKK